jgi:hypothetical protein
MTTTYTCPKCNGAGRLSCYEGILGGVCFSCDGKGVKPGKAPTPSIRWAVFGLDRTTGELVRLYNVKAKTDRAAIERSRATMAGASAAFKDQYTLDGALAINATEADTLAA